MKMYMIRHGESEANFNRQHFGQGQTPLTQKGEDDARKAGEILKNYSFDMVYSSDLIRAMKTQKIALPDREAVLSELLRELAVGSLKGHTFKECEETLGEEYIYLRSIKDFRPYGGENKAAHVERTKKFMDELTDKEYENVAVFTHMGTINCALDLVLGEEREKTLINNCGIYLFEYKDSKWTFIKEITE